MRIIDKYTEVFDSILNDSCSDITSSTKLLRKRMIYNTIVGPFSLHMRNSDIWYHTYRMYLLGENSISFPWYLPKDFPENALDPQRKQRILKFIKKE
jgi:hypothetical protein